MIKMNEDNRNKQIKFERNLITFPYLGFAFIVLLFNIFYTDVKLQWSYLVYSLLTI